jgi:hypothetical protein
MLAIDKTNRDHRVLNLLALLYGLLVTFVIASASHNLRGNRPHGPALAVVGWGAMSASFAGAGLLLATAAGLLTI